MPGLGWALDGPYLGECYLWTEWITRLIEMISGQVHFDVTLLLFKAV